MAKLAIHTSAKRNKLCHAGPAGNDNLRLSLVEKDCETLCAVKLSAIFCPMRKLRITTSGNASWENGLILISGGGKAPGSWSANLTKMRRKSSDMSWTKACSGVGCSLHLGSEGFGSRTRRARRPSRIQYPMRLGRGRPRPPCPMRTRLRDESECPLVLGCFGQGKFQVGHPRAVDPIPVYINLPIFLSPAAARTLTWCWGPVVFQRRS